MVQCQQRLPLTLTAMLQKSCAPIDPGIPSFFVERFLYPNSAEIEGEMPCIRNVMKSITQVNGLKQAQLSIK